MDNAEIERRFKFWPANPTTAPALDAMRARMLEVAQYVDREIPDGREKSCAFTALEEAMFWANAGIARPIAVDQPRR